MKITITEEHYRELAGNPDQASKAIQAAIRAAEDAHEHIPLKPPPRSVQEIQAALMEQYKAQMAKLHADIRKLVGADL
jgi:hypothetical protein